MVNASMRCRLTRWYISTRSMPPLAAGRCARLLRPIAPATPMPTKTAFFSCWRMSGRERTRRTGSGERLGMAHPPLAFHPGDHHLAREYRVEHLGIPRMYKEIASGMEQAASPRQWFEQAGLQLSKQ